jgi:hypothetical protein
MSEKNLGADIFSFERTPRTISSAAGIEPYFPYATAWKEFDKLQKKAQSNGPIRIVISVLELLLFGGGLVGHHLMNGSEFIIIMCWGAALAVELSYWFGGRRRFLHWECPRCHSEWPGSKTEKDRACKSCGLGLHQLSL